MNILSERERNEKPRLQISGWQGKESDSCESVSVRNLDLEREKPSLSWAGKKINVPCLTCAKSIAVNLKALTLTFGREKSASLGENKKFKDFVSPTTALCNKCSLHSHLCVEYTDETLPGFVSRVVHPVHSPVLVFDEPVKSQLTGVTCSRNLLQLP